MNRTEAIRAVGIRNVEAVEALNCEPTGECGENGLMHGDSFIGYSASAKIDLDSLTQNQLKRLDGCDTLTVHYSESNEMEQAAIDADCNVWDLFDIELDSYELV